MLPEKHPYRGLRMPVDAPFELRPSPGKGWGAFATKKIKQDSIILAEKPLFSFQKMPHEVTDEELNAAFQQLGPREKKKILLLRNAAQCNESLREIFDENNFRLFSTLDDSHPGICGLYPHLSRFNHSCIPNARYEHVPAKINVLATRDIAIGDEITFCYAAPHEYFTRYQRAHELPFECTCKACLIGTPFQQLSDMRRTIIRGLHYLIYGCDFNGKKHTAQLSIICDPRAKQAAEDQQITLSTTLVHFLLMMTLLEEEEILSSVMVEKYGGIPGFIAGTFQSRNNVRVVSLAMKKDTWREKLCAVIQIYGNKDLADNGILFRMVPEYINMAQFLTK